MNTNGVSPHNTPSEDQYTSYIGDIKSSKVNRVKTLLDNPLVKNIFTIENCDDGTEILACGPCSKSEACGAPSGNRFGMKLLDGSGYSLWEAGLKMPMT